MSKRRGLFDWENVIHYNTAATPPATVPIPKPWEQPATPDLPPVAWGYRRTPFGRADTLEAGVKVPFWQGVIVGFFPGVVVCIGAGVIVGLAGGPWWVAPVSGVVVWCGVAGWRIWKFVDLRQEIQWQRERLERRDLNGDGYIGKPPTVTVEVMDVGKKQAHYIDLGIEPDKVVTFAQSVITGRGLTVAEWTGRGGLLSRSEFERLRTRLLEAGLVRWVNPHARQQGVTLTQKGKIVFQQLANVSPADLE